MGVITSSAKLIRMVGLLFLFLLPTQLGTFFFFPFSYAHGMRVDYLAPAIYLTDILVLIMAVLMIVNKRTLITTLFQSRILYVIFLFFAINVATSTEPMIALYRVLKWIEVGMVICVFSQFKTKPVVILYALIAGAVLQLLLVVFQITQNHTMQGFAYFLGERSFSLATPGIAKISMQGVEILRGYGTFSHPNALAGFYLLAFSWILCDKRFDIEPLKSLFLSASTILILFSFSKIALVGFLLVNVIRILTMKSTCFVCTFAKILVPITLASVFFASQGDPDSLDKRIWLAQSALAIIRDFPLFGVGLGNYIFAQSTIPIPYSYQFLQPVHNIFLLWLSETGIVTNLVILGGFGFAAYARMIKLAFSWKKYLPIVFVIIFTGFFDHYWLTQQQNILLAGTVFGLLQGHKGMVQ